MKIQTTRFGDIEFPDEVLLNFPEGILGFPQDRRYVLLEHDMENSPFKWLQSADSADLAFIILDPLLLAPEFAVSLDSDTARMIRCSDPTRCAFMSIVNIPADDPMRMTANLKAPLVINPELRYGRQIIMGAQVFSINESIFPRIQDRMAAASGAESAVPA